MARGEKSVAAATFLLLLGLSALVNEAKAENLFPTYEDDLQDQARVGVISLTGSKSNVTLNLSGIVILGLSLSAAVSFWAYTLSALEKTPFANLFNQHQIGKLSPSTSSLNYTLNLSGLLVLGLGVAAATMFWAQITSLNDNRLKRSLEDDSEISLSVALNNIHRRFENNGVYETICRQRVVCQVANGNEVTAKLAENTFGSTISKTFGSKNGSKPLKELLENDKRAKAYLEAWNEGKRGKMCKVTYDKCSMTMDSIDGLIASEQ